VFLALFPFILFDLRHPPGIFLLGALNQAQKAQEFNFFANLIKHVLETLKYYTQSTILIWPLGLGVLALLFNDFRRKKKNLFFLLPIFFQMIMVSLVFSYNPLYTGFWYFFPIIPFLFVWLLLPRVKIGRFLSSFLMVLLVLAGVLKTIPFLTESPVHPDLSTVKKIDQVLKNEIKKKNLQNVNLVVLASPDPTNFGRKYRDLLLIPDNLQILTKEVHDYEIADHLFVISASSEETVRKDAAFEINNFRSGPLKGQWLIDKTPWTVYLLTRNEK
jgi:hypothetical protein